MKIPKRRMKFSMNKEFHRNGGPKSVIVIFNIVFICPGFKF